jgi:hypothetical protein
LGEHDLGLALAAVDAFELSLSLLRPTRRGALLLLTAAGLAAACKAGPGGGRPEPTSTASARATEEHGAILLVAEPKHDFGRALQGVTLRHSFTTRNATAATLEVEAPREVLGCSGVPLPPRLAPGQTGKLEVSCRANIYGPLHVSLPLRANGQAAGELELTAEVEPLLAFDRALLEVSVPFGTSGSAEARLRGANAATARLLPLTAPPGGMAVAVLPPAGAGSQGVVLRVTSGAAGIHAGSLRFATGLAAPKEIEIGYRVKVASTLAISPTNPFLDLGAPAGSPVLVKVSSQRAGFRVERAEVLEGPFDARVRRDGDAYAIEVTIVAEKLDPGMRSANGRLLIVSNDRAEPTKEVPLFALGSPARAGNGSAR